MLRSPSKCVKVAKLEHVDSKKQLFARGIYTGSPEPPTTSSPNRRPEGRLGRGWGERLGKRLGARLRERLKGKQ